MKPVLPPYGYSPGGSRGIALVVTMFVLAFLTVLAAGFTRTIHIGTAAVRNFKEDAAAYYRAVGAVEEALDYLANDEAPLVDFIDKDGLFRTDPEAPPLEPLRTYADGTARVDIVDLDARINPNTVAPQILEVILRNAGYEDERIRTAIDSLMDWRDPDDDHRLNGAETDHYEEETPPYPAKNGPLDTVDELRLVRGFGDDALDGGGEDELQGLREHLSVRTSGTLNINTVRRETMVLLGITPLEIENVELARAEGIGPITTITSALFPGRGDHSALFGTTNSKNLRIVASAGDADGKNTHRVVADVRRFLRPKGGFRLEILYWRDDAV